MLHIFRGPGFKSRPEMDCRKFMRALFSRKRQNRTEIKSKTILFHIASNMLFTSQPTSGDRIPVGRDFPPVQTGPGTHPASCTMGTGSFLGLKYCRGVLLITHPLLVPSSWKSRAIPLPTLWATTGPVTGTLYLYLFYLSPYLSPLLCLTC